LTASEARHTGTVQTTAGMVAAVAPVAAGLPAAVSAFEGLDRWIGLGLIVAGLVALVAGAWVVTTWLRMQRV
jgi:hypothetical protein